MPSLKTEQRFLEFSLPTNSVTKVKMKQNDFCYERVSDLVIIKGNPLVPFLRYSQSRGLKNLEVIRFLVLEDQIPSE